MMIDSLLASAMLRWVDASLRKIDRISRLQVELSFDRMERVLVIHKVVWPSIHGDDIYKNKA